MTEGSFELYSGYNDFWSHTIIKDNFFLLQEKRLINDMHVLNLCLLFTTERQFFFVAWSTRRVSFTLGEMCLIPVLTRIYFEQLVGWLMFYIFCFA